MLERVSLLWRALRYRYKLDPAELSAVIARVPRGGTAIDLGAHKGAYTFWMSRAAGRAGRVIAVEPQPPLADRLRHLFPDGRGNVSVHWCAVCGRAGAIQLSVPGEGSSPGASIYDKGPGARTISVPGLSLAELVEHHQLSRLDFIKCDTEGAELEIFSAARPVLDRFRPALLVECENRHGGGAGSGTAGPAKDHVGAFVSLFQDLGYDAAFFYAGRLVPAAQFDAATHQVPGVKPYGNNWLLTPRP